MGDLSKIKMVVDNKITFACCWNYIGDDTYVCPKCGEMIISKTISDMTKHFKFCGSCGSQMVIIGDEIDESN